MHYSTEKNLDELDSLGLVMLTVTEHVEVRRWTLGEKTPNWFVLRQEHDCSGG